jgi:FAD/FMN-containing dehydrogenase
MTRRDVGWRELKRAIGGAVVQPDSTDYEQVRRPKMLRFHDIRPEAIVLCRSPEDVSEAITFARRHTLETAIRSGGHSVAGCSSTEGLVIDVTPMNAISVNEDVTTVGAGVRLGELEDALQPFGLTIPAGSSHSVGIAGLTLGGGLGVLGRKYGLTCDHLLRAQAVLADGAVVDCDERDDPDLFWGLRGAGGGLGVVTSLAFQTVPSPEATVFHLIWPYGSALSLIRVWQEWAPDAPEEVDATLRLNVNGDDGQTTVDLFGVVLGTDAEAARLIDPLVAGSRAEPTSASFRQVAYVDTRRYLDGLPPDEVWRDVGHPNRSPPRDRHLFTKSEFFRQTIPSETISSLANTLLEGLGRGQTREVTFTPWGGAYNRVPRDVSAFVHRKERFIVQHLLSIDPDALARDLNSSRSWLRRSWALVHQSGAGGVYPNFPDPDLDGPYSYLKENYDRFLRVKSHYDPNGFLRFIPSRR